MANFTKDRSALQVSGNTVFRFREPTNPAMAKHMTQYVVDYSQQAAHIPNRIKKVMIEATQGHERKNATINRSGRSAVFGPAAGVQLGSSPDEAGNY